MITRKRNWKGVTMENPIEIKNCRPVIKCPHCGKDSPWDSSVCVKCGRLVRREPHGTGEGKSDS